MDPHGTPNNDTWKLGSRKFLNIHSTILNSLPSTSIFSTGKTSLQDQLFKLDFKLVVKTWLRQ
jgi:hypothetical protein